MNSNNPPFATPCKAICIDKDEDARKNTDYNEEIHLNSVYELTDCFWKWLPYNFSCWMVKIKGLNTSWKASSFAPIQDQYNDITEQLASEMKEVVEAPDIKKIVEPQTN